MIEVFGLELTGPVLILGVITGMTYGILAVGLVLIYRSNRIVNFAHGEIGAFGAALLGLAVVQWGVPYWVAFPLALAASAAAGALAEVAVVRRLRKAPALMSIVATLGVGQFILLFSFALNAQAGAGQIYPQPPGFPEFDVGPLRITQAFFGMLFLTPLLMAGLTLFLKRSRIGLGIRASAANPEAARLSRVSPSRMSGLSWAIAGAVSAYTAILILPTRGFVSGEALGPGLLLRALVGAVIARMNNLPLALGAGIGVGVIEQGLLWNFPEGGLVEMVLLVVILVGLVLQPRTEGRAEEKGSWAALQAWRPLPEAFRKVWSIRNLQWIAGSAALLVALVLPAVITNTAAVILVTIMAFSLVGVSLGIVTGLGGQLTLGQFALAGIGAAASYHLVAQTGNYLLGFLGAGGAAALTAVVIGLPAFRIRGLMLAVTTLSFALAAQAWLFVQPWIFFEGVDPGRPILGNFVVETGKQYYYFSLFFLAAALLFAGNLRRSGVGRRLISIRDNEDQARAFTIPAGFVKLQGFALAGFVAGLGGAIYGHALSIVSPEAFPTAASINVVAMTVLGGISILVGPLLGALYIIGVPEFIPLDSAGLAASSFGWLLLILYFPGGIAQLMRPLRDRTVDLLARRAGIDPQAVRNLDRAQETRATKSGEKRAGKVARHSARLRAWRVRGIDWSRPPAPRETASDAGPEEPDSKEWSSVLIEVDEPGDASLADRGEASAPAEDSEILLEAKGLSKSFGGVRAVDDASLSVRNGETLGLIGPNGAGKTTLFEILGGFTRPDAGQVLYNTRDVTTLRPEGRARLGLVRSFQDVALFPTMTVVDTVKLALERSAPTRLFPSLAGLPRAERQKDERARQIVRMMGLDHFRDKQINELSTGTRRITEVACLVALEPKLLLLDEPSSGIAQRETEALGELLAKVRERLNATLVIIEHDIPLIMSLADRIIAMESGSVIAEGSPEEIRNNPLVIESYLGGDVTAIERSGGLTGAAAGAQE